MMLARCTKQPLMDGNQTIRTPPQAESVGGLPVHARLLGSFALFDPTGRDLSLAGRKVRALLAYLILAGGRRVARQELVNLAWADRGVEQGRASLRQALHEARRVVAIQPSLVIADRDSVRIDTSRLDTDLDSILNHAREGRVEALIQALSLCQSPLLGDLDGIDANIDRWLAGERQRWADELHSEIRACISRASSPENADEIGVLCALLPKSVPDVEMAAAHRARERHRPSLARWTVPIALGLMVALSGIAVTIGFRTSRPRAEDILLVEPLQASASDRPAQLIRAGLSGDLAGVLVGRPAGLDVAQAGGPHPRPRQTQLTLDGNAATIGPDLQVHLQLADSRTHVILWSQNFSGPAARAEALREQVATKLGSVLNCALSTRHRGRAAVGDPAAMLYLKACDLIGDYRLDPALDLLRQVTIQAPGFARAWADLAVTRSLAAKAAPSSERAAAYAEADMAAHRALRIDPRTGLAYYALAQTMPGITNWPRRIATLEQGLLVEPDGSELNNALGRELLRVGRSADGLAYVERAMNLDPLNPVKTATLIPMLAYYGDLDGAEALATKARTLWPGNPIIWTAVFDMEARAGDPTKALAMTQDPLRPGLRAQDEARLWTTTLRARIDPTSANVDAAVEEWTRHADPDRDPLPVALMLSSLGRTDLAYRMLSNSKAPADDSVDEGMFRNGLGAFRTDPRFITLAAQRGLVAIWRSTGHWPDVCAEQPIPQGCPARAGHP